MVRWLASCSAVLLLALGGCGPDDNGLAKDVANLLPADVIYDAPATSAAATTGSVSVPVTKAGWTATVSGGNLASAVVVGADAQSIDASSVDGPWAAATTVNSVSGANVAGTTVSSAVATPTDVNGARIVKADWNGMVHRAPRDVQVSPAPVAWGAVAVTPYLPPQPPPGLGPYLLDTGDKLRVFVYGQPSLSRLYAVDQSGNVAIPLIGNVRARDRTTTELARAIADRLGREFVRDPQVTVDVALNRPFFILGEVRLPGQYPYVSGMTVETAVAIAGGYTERASQRCFRITRRFHNGLVDQIEAPADYILRPGDTVYVYERYF